MTMEASAGRSLLSIALGNAGFIQGGAARARKGNELVPPADAESGLAGQEEQPVPSELDPKNRAGWALLKAALRLSIIGKEAIDGLYRESVVDRAFETADCLENGTARECTTDFTTPLRRSSRLAQFRIIRSADKLQARLMSECGDFLLFAQVRLQQRRIDFHTYPPTGEGSRLFNPKSPAFYMVWDERRIAWQLVQDKCAHCQFAPPHMSCACLGKQQLAYVEHSKVPIGDGLFNCMCVRIPGVYSDGSCVIWCPMLGRGLLAAVTEEGQRSHETQLLVTKHPAWNDEVGSLVLDFRGRDVQASAKNFQTALQQKPNHVICQYGKLSGNTFGLDFRYPLNAIQAFAMAMSTIFWT